MNILLLYPKKENKPKSAFNRLSSFLISSTKENIKLIEISIHLPLTWAEKMIDLNHDKLLKKDILWADYIVICADKMQTQSTLEVVQRCKSENKKLVLCGNAIQTTDEEFRFFDHYVPTPAGFEQFSNDIANNTLQKIYTPVLPSTSSVEFRAYSLWGIIGNFSRQIQAHSA